MYDFSEIFMFGRRHPMQKNKKLCLLSIGFYPKQRHKYFNYSGNNKVTLLSMLHTGKRTHLESDASCTGAFWSGTEKAGEKCGIKEGDLALYTGTALVLLHIWNQKSNKSFSLTLILFSDFKEISIFPRFFLKKYKAAATGVSSTIDTSFNLTVPAFASCPVQTRSPVTPARSLDHGTNRATRIAFRTVSGSCENSAQVTELSTVLEQQANKQKNPTTFKITESQNGRGWKGPLWVI